MHARVLLPRHKQSLFLLQAWGYATVQAYYDDINGLKWIPKIKTPTLFLSAEDDPFLGQVSGNLQSLCS